MTGRGFTELQIAQILRLNDQLWGAERIAAFLSCSRDDVRAVLAAYRDATLPAGGSAGGGAGSG